jgi:LmbE family N-acetylglucosaminyl deacetylase
VVPLAFRLPPRARLLCLGAHADDIEIGCGGTVLRLLREHPGLRVHWLVLSAAGRRADEARASARRFLGRARSVVEIEGFRDGYLPAARAEVKDRFERLKRAMDPDLILTHHEGDLHQDHDLIGRLTRETFRDHAILGYEVPKYDGGLGMPNVFVPLDAATRRRKVRLLMSGFPSQRSKRWFSPETFDAVMRLRGIECAAPTGYAEAFHGRKLVLDP